MKKILSQFHQALQVFSLRRGDRVVVAVSGGSDSIALLKLFSLTRKNTGLSVSVAHLDHGLRRASKGDSDFVRKIAAHEGFDFFGAKEDVHARAAREKLSTEEAARLIRYEFLFGIAKKIRARAIATAHTMDDQAETVLMRLLRGSGLKGLSAIPSEREERGVRLVRPVLSFRKAELEAFLRENRIAWRDDSSNKSLDFFRNRIRRELLPKIRTEYSPQFDAHLVQLSEFASAAQDFVSHSAAIQYRRMRKKRAGAVILPSQKVSLAPLALRAEILFLAIEEACGTRRLFSQAHIAAIERLCRSTTSAAARNLPRGLVVQRQGENLVFKA